MKAKLVVEGKEFPIEILDPELQKLLAPQKKTGYERVDIDGNFFSEYGGQAVRIKSCDDSHKSLYTSANYYSDETVAQNNARADKLMRQLRRFAVEHRKNELGWSDTSQRKYYIYYDYMRNELIIDHFLYCRNFCDVYFDTQELAEIALDGFKEELIWYFTEYKGSL